MNGDVLGRFMRFYNPESKVKEEKQKLKHQLLVPKRIKK